MAKQTKKTTQKSTAKQTVEKRSKQNKALEKSAKPIRREIGAAICLFLGIFTILSIFGVKSWFTTKLLAPFCKGLVGNAGFYILPASFFFSTFILLFHGGRPVRLRVTACFVMAGCIGAITHLFLDTVGDPLGHLHGRGPLPRRHRRNDGRPALRLFFYAAGAYFQQDWRGPDLCDPAES